MGEYDSICQEIVQEGDKSGILDVEIHGFENGPFGNFVFFLGVILVGIALVPVEVGDVLVELDAFRGYDQAA